MVEEPRIRDIPLWECEWADQGEGDEGGEGTEERTEIEGGTRTRIQICGAADATDVGEASPVLREGYGHDVGE
jgi:hypothetical protein